MLNLSLLCSWVCRRLHFCFSKRGTLVRLQAKGSHSGELKVGLSNLTLFLSVANTNQCSFEMNGNMWDFLKMFLGCLMSQHHASVSEGWICSDNCMQFFFFKKTVVRVVYKQTRKEEKKTNKNKKKTKQTSYIHLSEIMAVLSQKELCTPHAVCASCFYRIKEKKIEESFSGLVISCQEQDIQRSIHIS